MKKVGKEKYARWRDRIEEKDQIENEMAFIRLSEIAYVVCVDGVEMTFERHRHLNLVDSSNIVSSWARIGALDGL